MLSLDSARIGRVRWSRRAALQGCILSATGAVVAACSSAAPAQPTTAPAAAPTGAAGSNAVPTATAASAPAATTPTAAPTTASAASAPTTAPTTAASPTAAAAAAPSGTTTTIPLYTTENDPSSIDFYKRTIASFQQSHPGTDLKITLYQDETELQYLTTAFQTGTDLGIFTVHAAEVGPWIQAGYLTPLDALVQKLGADDFLPGTRLTIGGHDYAMPYQANASALWVRKDLFQKEGLKIPQTYDDMLAAAKALNKNGIAGIATGVGAVPELTLQYFTPYIYQSGWDYFDKEGTLTFDQPEVLDAVKRFTDILKNAPKSFANVTYPDIINAYVAGKAAMGTFPGRLGVNTAAKAPQIADVTTVVPVPAGPFMTGKLLFGGIAHYALFSKTAKPDLTLEFLQYMTTGERELDFAMTVPGHLLPPLKSVAAKIKDYQSPFMSKYGSWVIDLSNMVPGAGSPALSMGSVNNHQFKRIGNVCPWGSKVWGGPPVDGTMFQEILLKGTDPEVAWKNAAATMKKDADDWKKANPAWKPTA